MKRRLFQMITLSAAVLFMSVTFMEMNAEARAGGSRSMGSRGSRSYSRPASPYSQPSPSRPQNTPSPSTRPFQQPSPGGGFLRSMAGGMLGGLMGGMLFRSLGFGGMGGGFGGGIGLFDILLLAGIGYMIYRFVKKRRAETPAYQSQYGQTSYQEPIQASYQPVPQNYEPEQNDAAAGLLHIRQMDSAFDERRFSDNVMDIFFKIQSAWMNRDLAPAGALLTGEMKRVMQDDIDALLRDRRINRLENIAVRNVEIVEAWQETGQDFITVLIYANLLDYTTDEAGTILSGSRTEPVKFEEYWTFTRQVGNNPWQLSAIEQK